MSFISFEVFLGVHESGLVSLRVAELNAIDPAGAVWILVDQERAGVDFGVDLRHLAAHRGKNAKSGFDGFNLADLAALLDLGARLHYLQKSHVAFGFLHEVGQPDGGHTILNVCPELFFAV